MKKQVVVIGGGETFDTYAEYLKYLRSWVYNPRSKKRRGADWKANLQKDLGRGYEVIHVRMPCALNAKYQEWELYFRSYIPHLREGVQFVGHSLGGIFLLKFLSENKLPVQIRAIYAVAPPFCVKTFDGLADFVLGRDWDPKISGKVRDPLKLRFENIHLFHSEDDDVVPFENSVMYRTQLGEETTLHKYKDKGHFIFQKKIKELISLIKRKTT